MTDSLELNRPVTRKLGLVIRSRRNSLVFGDHTWRSAVPQSVANDPTQSAGPHIFEQTDPEVGRHLRFREFLRKNPEKTAAYSALKEKLARV